MASTGRAKWVKYFSRGDVETKVQNKSGPIPVYDPTGKSKTDSLSNGDDVRVPLAKDYAAKYVVVYKKNGKEKIGTVEEKYIAKPIAKKATAPNITASDFIEKGKKINDFDYHGDKVVGVTFSSPKQLTDSIMDGMKKIKDISPVVAEIFEDYFKGGYKKIEWEASLSEQEINKYGVYLGELLIGLLALAKKNNTTFSPNILKTGKVKEFFVPTQSNFAGIDSIIVMDTGEHFPISSKFGVGAKASIFSNLYGKGLEYYNKLKPSVFKDLIEVGKKNNITAPERMGKEIVYHYGVRTILGIKSGNSKQDIRDVMSVYKSIKKGEMTDEAILAVQRISIQDELEKLVAEKLPDSITAFFCRTIASRLNSDKNSIEEMKKILSGKNYWQANLNISKWKKGEVEFKLANSGNVDLKIIGNKSGVNDIEAKQGLINYELKPK